MSHPPPTELESVHAASQLYAMTQSGQSSVAVAPRMDPGELRSCGALFHQLCTVLPDPHTRLALVLLEDELDIGSAVSISPGPSQLLAWMWAYNPRMQRSLYDAAWAVTDR